MVDTERSRGDGVGSTLCRTPKVKQVIIHPPAHNPLCPRSQQLTVSTRIGCDPSLRVLAIARKFYGRHPARRLVRVRK